MTAPPPRFLLRGRCCRDWPLSPFGNVGRCGYCGERPEVLGLWDDTEPGPPRAREVIVLREAPAS